MDIGRQLLSDFIVHSKYAQYREDLGRREVWSEIVDRNKAMHIRKFPELREEIDEAYKLVYEKKVLPSMRGMQYGGKAIEKNNARGFNCFNADTEFVTSAGPKKFSDFIDGDVIKVLTHKGRWRNATVRSYGEQRFNRVVVKRGGHALPHEVIVTANHRWIKNDESDTTDLQVGDKLLGCDKVFDKFDYDTAEPFERLYWCYGFVFGDGTKVIRGGNNTHSMVRLCGGDVKYLPRFEEMGFKSSSPLSCNGDIMVYTGKYLKTVPDPNIDSPALIRAFVAGYLAADGTKVNCKSSTSKYRGIVASDKTHIDAINKLFPIAGVFISSRQWLGDRSTNYGKRNPDTMRFVISTCVRCKTNSTSRVISIEDSGIKGTAWCLEVEEDESFVLANGLATGNCSFIPIDTPVAFSEAIFLLLSGCGVGFSVRQNEINKLPSITKPTKQRKFVIGDSIEGWADALRGLMRSYFYGKPLPRFDYSDIRPKGSKISSGGVAPGPEPLRIALELIASILRSKEDGDKLTSVECMDIICHASDAVLAGGVRRSALVCLFDKDDTNIATAKVGGWWELNPQRGRSNNSVSLVRDNTDLETFNRLWDVLSKSGSGEPGFFWSNDAHNTMGLNPCCFTGNMRLLTDDGYIGLEELVGKEYLQLVDPNTGYCANGKVWYKDELPTINLIMSTGKVITCTPDHIFVDSDNNEVEAKDLKKLRLKVPRRGKPKDITEFVKLGYIQGDGGTGRLRSATHRGAEIIFGKKDGDVAQLFGTTEYRFYTREYIEKMVEIGMNSSPLPERTLPTNFVNFGYNEQLSYLKGMYSANGSVITTSRIAYKTTCKILAHELSSALVSFGLSPYITTNKEKLVKFDNGDYVCRESYDINLGQFNDIVWFADNIGFVQQYKCDSLEKLIAKRSPMVLNIKFGGIQKVYDFSINTDSHLGVVEGVVVHNCEVGLNPAQFCNLCEINASDILDQADFNHRVKSAAFIGTLQASYTDFHYLRPIWQEITEQEALLGISLTGIASMNIFSLDITEAAKISVEENIRVSKLINIKPAARVNTVKPAGTTSSLLGCSSGIHAWHSQFFIRRVRLGKEEAMYKYLVSEMPELMEDEFFNPDNMAVFSIPMKAPDGAVTREESTIDLLERVALVYESWILPGHISGINTHNVSTTISVRENEWEQVGKWMWENRYSYAAIACLPYDGTNYPQMPFESITEETYYNMLKKVKRIVPEWINEDVDNTNLKEQAACAGGACAL